jgi:hypothetical protein
VPETDGETALKNRRLGRMRRKSRQMWNAQHYRLMQIAEGRMEPHFEREHLFLWTLRGRRTANLADFILPGLLFMAEATANPLEKVAAWCDDDEREAILGPAADVTAS